MAGAAALAALWVLKTSAIGILFPVLIAMLVPLRLGMARWFTEGELEALDAEEEVSDLDHEIAGGADVHA